MSKYIVVRYTHTTGMPSAQGGWVEDLNLARRHALAKSQENPDDWVRIETDGGELLDSYFKGMKVEPYIGRPENLRAPVTLSPRPEPNVRFSGGIIVRDAYMAECSGVHLVKNDTPGKSGVIINFMEGKQLPTSPLPSLEQGWRAVGVILPPSDARLLAENLKKYADQAERR